MSKFKVGTRVRPKVSLTGEWASVLGYDSKGWVQYKYDIKGPYIAPESELICPKGLMANYRFTDSSSPYALHKEPPQDSKPDGGPAGYYDLPEDRPMNTLNDILEWKGETQWLGDSFHLANVTKAGWRWGIKDGTTREYDARKFIYSGARLLMKYAGVKELRKTLQKMLDDPQFQLNTDEASKEDTDD